jgi:glycosyltransferase involved in cell wall biosynthesis
MGNKKIAIWGTTPPPIGGMSVHIERLTSLLKRDGISYLLYNFTNIHKPEQINVKHSGLWYLSLLFSSSPKIHYIITTRNWIRLLAVIFGLLRNKRIIVRVGGQSFENAFNKSLRQKLISIFILKGSYAFIGVNKEIFTLAKGYKKNNVYHIPGFIPPIEDNSTIPSKVKDFYGIAYLKVLVSGQIVSEDSFDIYGLYDILKLSIEIKKRELKYKICIFAYNSAEDDVFHYNKLITAFGLEDILYIHTEKEVLWPTIKYCDIYLRPSLTDGDCNALREALHYNKFVIASNAVSRPENTNLYVTGNIQALLSNIELFHDYQSKRVVSNNQNNGESILNIFKSCC